MPTEHPEIFMALAKPFPKECERTRSQGGVTLTYITARSVMNRLDEVVGAENWWPHYEETKDGIKCTITLRMPDGREVSKEDGGGFATSMKAEDDVEKSGYSDALKRAGVAWGIGRYLYRDGVPKFAGEVAAAPSRKLPGRPALPQEPYNHWLADFCDSVNNKWRIETCGPTGSVRNPANLVTSYQLNRHLLKALSIPAAKAEAENIKLGERAWQGNGEAMVAEARVYCRKLWKDAKAKLTPAREPGADDNMPSDDEHAVLDELALKA